MSRSANCESGLFAGYLDPIDMTGCFPANLSLEAINASVVTHGLRFPLVMDGKRSLSEHLECAEWAPASARFGPYVDNVLGMNWELPSGQAVRIGERVVKSTTGYDLQRFLLHSNHRFGRPLDFVLRLRPLGGAGACGQFSGNRTALADLQQQVRLSSWTHWIDSIDWVITGNDEEAMQVRVDCRPGEESVFAEAFEKMAVRSGTEFFAGKEAPAPGLPGFSIKCLPGQAPRIARQCVGELGGEARVLVVNGVVLVHSERPPDDDWLEELRRELHETGGHVSGKSLPAVEPADLEAFWIRAIEEKWGAL